MKSHVKPLVATAAVLVVFVLAAAIWVMVNRPATADVSGDPPPTARADSHVLDDGGEGAVVVVEFLDFECEACGAGYPFVEQLREEYAEQITYVVRYFPLPGHFNSTNAAVAAEAAARQGKFEEMYHSLFRSQGDWGEAQESQAALFRSFAEDIGLDMPTYDKDLADPETAARVGSDFTDGQVLGVSSTPTFFVNDRPLELTSWADLTDAINAELAR